MNNVVSLTNQVYKDFNRSLKAFLCELTEGLPHVGLLKFMNTSFYVLKKMNKRFPQRIFDKYLGSYEKKLLDRDESFFSSPDFSIPYWDGYIQQIQDVWKTLDAENKKAVWDHIVVVIALNRKCIEYRKSKRVSNGGDDSDVDLPVNYFGQSNMT